MTPKFVDVVALQLVSLADPEHNFSRIAFLLDQALQQGHSDIVVLPENALCFDAKRYRSLAQDDRYWLGRLQALAASREVALIIGSMPVSTRPDGQPVDGRCRQACFAIDKAGRVQGRYDKIHLFDVDVGDAQGRYRESESFEPGDQTVVVELAGARVGLSICYDLRFPLMFQKLREKGAELIVIPAAFTAVTGQAHWEVLVRARAIETQCYVVAPNQGGQHNPTRTTWGHSMIVSPWGEIMAQHVQGEGVVRARIDFERMSEIRHALPSFAHRRDIF